MRRRAILAACGFAALALACDDGSDVPTRMRPIPARAVAGGPDDGTAWCPPVNIAELNTAFIENAPEMSKDGLSLYFASNRPGGEGSQDVWVSRRSSVDDPWGTPVNLGALINTPLVEAGPHLSRDGHLLYYTSTRPGGEGSNDIWISHRADVHDDLAWEAPVNAGPAVNSGLFEAGPTVRRPEMYFARGPGVGASGAPADIYLSRMRGNGFETAELVVELSMPAPVHDQKPSIRYDGREIFLSSDRPATPGGPVGNQDIYVSQRSGDGQPWETPRNVTVLNSASRETTVSLSDDAQLLFFASERPGGAGNLDLWVARRAGTGCAP